jgi:GTP-binding protein
VTDQDAHIAGYILESGRAVVLAINKWDAIDATSASRCSARSSRAGLPEVRVAALHLGQEAPGPGPGVAVDRAGPQVGDHQDVDAGAHAPAAGGGAVPVAQAVGMFRPKLRYAHQGGMNPPVIVIHGNSLEHVTDAYKRFLEGRFRKEFNLVGTPLRIEFKTSKNPYADKE